MTDRVPFWLRYATFAAAGFVLAALLPGRVWAVVAVVAVSVFWTGAGRRNRRRTQLRGGRRA